MNNLHVSCPVDRSRTQNNLSHFTFALISIELLISTPSVHCRVKCAFIRCFISISVLMIKNKMLKSVLETKVPFLHFLKFILLIPSFSFQLSNERLHKDQDYRYNDKNEQVRHTRREIVWKPKWYKNKICTQFCPAHGFAPLWFCGVKLSIETSSFLQFEWAICSNLVAFPF